MQDKQWLTALGIGLVFVFGVTIVSLYVGFSLGRSTVEDRTVISPNIRVNPTHVSVQPPNVEVYPQNLAVDVRPPTVEVQVRELTDDLGVISKSVERNATTLKDLQELTAKTLKEVVIQGKAGTDVKTEVRKAIEAQLVKPPKVEERDPDGGLLPPPKK